MLLLFTNLLCLILFINQDFINLYYFSQSYSQSTVTHITMTPLTTEQRGTTATDAGTYDIYFEIDIDCEELLDAIGLDYVQCEDDDTQNEVQGP